MKHCQRPTAKCRLKRPLINTPLQRAERGALTRWVLPPGLINTPLQRGDCGLGWFRNRFNGFAGAWKTVEAVPCVRPSPCTPLKRGVNEN
jgi:hypothetical protein